MGRSILNQNEDRAVIMDQAIRYFEQIISQNDSQISAVSERDSTRSEDITTSSEMTDIIFQTPPKQTKFVGKNTRSMRSS